MKIPIVGILMNCEGANSISDGYKVGIWWYCNVFDWKNLYYAGVLIVDHLNFLSVMNGNRMIS